MDKKITQNYFFAGANDIKLHSNGNNQNSHRIHCTGLCVCAVKAQPVIMINSAASCNFYGLVISCNLKKIYLTMLN